MKIIKEGFLKGLRHYLATCPECGCVFEFLPNEASRLDGKLVAIDCPTCGKEVTRIV